MIYFSALSNGMTKSSTVSSFVAPSDVSVSVGIVHIHSAIISSMLR